MTKKDPILTPELVKIIKIFVFTSLGLVILLSFFNGYRANNSNDDRTFSINDSNRLYFLNVRSIYYDREVRRDAGMSLFRHGKRRQSDSLPTLDLVILLNSAKESAYIFFELENAEWPIKIIAKSQAETAVLEFRKGNNADHFAMYQQLKTFIKSDAEFEMDLGQKSIPLWTEPKEKAAIKLVIEDYDRLLNQTN